MRLNKALDWLTGTAIAEHTSQLPPLMRGMKIADERRPPAHFDFAWDLFPAGTLALSETSTMCMRMIQFTGSELTKLREQLGTDDSRIIQYLCNTCKNVSRLDYAIDIFETDASPLDILGEWQAKRLKTRYRTVQDFKTYTGFKGHTVYFGSKNSRQRIRIYDKAAEMKLLKTAWLRVELQARKEHATALANDMNVKGISKCGDSRIRQLLSAPAVEWYQKATDNKPATLTEIPRRDSNWQRWLNSQVLASIETHAKNKDDRVFLLDWIQSVIEAVENATESTTDAM